MRITGELQEKMITFFADPECRQIISSVLAEPKTATTIRTELKLPASSVYRKISELKDSGLLLIDHFAIKSDGKREAFYSCSFSEINFRVKEGVLELNVVQSPKSLEKRWFELFFSKAIPSPAPQPSRSSEMF